MNDIKKYHYILLKEKYNDLIKIIMGPKYYTFSTSVIDSDMEAFEDMKYKINRLKNDLKIYKMLFSVTLLIIFLIIIFVIL